MSNSLAGKQTVANSRVYVRGRCCSSLDEREGLITFLEIETVNRRDESIRRVFPLGSSRALKAPAISVANDSPWRAVMLIDDFLPRVYPSRRRGIKHFLAEIPLRGSAFRRRRSFRRNDIPRGSRQLLLLAGMRKFRSQRPSFQKLPPGLCL